MATVREIVWEDTATGESVVFNDGKVAVTAKSETYDAATRRVLGRAVADLIRQRDNLDKECRELRAELRELGKDR